MTTHDITIQDEHGPETVGLFEHLDIATTKAWRLFHGINFFIGGSTFIIGTILYFFPDMPQAFYYSALLYIIGSLGFLFVDMLEFFTYTDNGNLLRMNISLSMAGSAFYVIGSCGFLPSVYEANHYLGPWGFIIGSALIFMSQSWKVIRILREDQFESSQLDALGKSSGWRPLSRCAKTAIGVEADAGLGALMFLIGTIMYVACEPSGSYLTFILLLWILGSVFFTTGSLFLNYRHFIMKLCR